MIALERERLLEIAYRLADGLGWVDQGGKKVSMTAISTVAGIFAEFVRYPGTGKRMKKALEMIEALSGSPLARYGMQKQYQTIIDVLKIKKGEMQHPDLKGLSFEELAYVMGWLSRIFRARAAGIMPAVVPTSESDGKSKGETVRKKKKGETPQNDDLDPWKKALKEWMENKQKT